MTEESTIESKRNPLIIKTVYYKIKSNSSIHNYHYNKYGNLL
jgi:hypothetical protein